MGIIDRFSLFLPKTTSNTPGVLIGQIKLTLHNWPLIVVQRQLAGMGRLETAEQI